MTTARRISFIILLIAIEVSAYLRLLSVIVCTDGRLKNALMAAFWVHVQTSSAQLPIWGIRSGTPRLLIAAGGAVLLVIADWRIICQWISA